MSDLVSFAEHVAWWIRRGWYVVWLVTGIIVLFYYWPAFRRYRTRGLLLIVISLVVDLVVTALEFTVGRPPEAPPLGYWVSYSARELTHIVTAVLGTVGSIMFLRDYMRFAPAPPRNSDGNP
jgi:hypothetical protein